MAATIALLAREVSGLYPRLPRESLWVWSYLINVSSVSSARPRSSSTWTPSPPSAAWSWCPASSTPPPDPRSGASGAECRSLPRTRRWSTPEGSWASWRRPWLLWKADSVGVRNNPEPILPVYQVSGSRESCDKLLEVHFTSMPCSRGFYLPEKRPFSDSSLYVKNRKLAVKATIPETVMDPNSMKAQCLIAVFSTAISTAVDKKKNQAILHWVTSNASLLAGAINRMFVCLHLVTLGVKLLHTHTTQVARLGCLSHLLVLMCLWFWWNIANRLIC